MAICQGLYSVVAASEQRHLCSCQIMGRQSSSGFWTSFASKLDYLAATSDKTTSHEGIVYQTGMQRCRRQAWAPDATYIYLLYNSLCLKKIRHLLHLQITPISEIKPVAIKGRVCHTNLFSRIIRWSPYPKGEFL